MSSEPSFLAGVRYICLVCEDSLFPPVFQCHDGHLMCEGCSFRWNCGVCGVTLKQPEVDRVRNLALERIIRIIQHPCPNETDGCQAKLKFDELEAHRFECYYSKFPICKLLFGERHCQEVRICDYEDHYEKKHGDKLVDFTEPATLPATQTMELSILDVDKHGYLASFKLEFGNKTVLFVFDMSVDAEHNRVECKPWVLAGKAVANQLNCKIIFLSGNGVNATMNAPIFNLETKKEDLVACASISLPYFRTIFPSPDESGKNRIRFKISKKTGTLCNDQASSAMDLSST